MKVGITGEQKEERKEERKIEEIKIEEIKIEEIKIEEIKIIDQIKPLDESAMNAAKDRTDSLMKPLGSLGFLETLGVQLAGITGSVHNAFEKRCTIVMAADNGICQEGVASAPKEITRIQTGNIAAGLTGISALSKVNGADVYVVDVGVEGPCEGSNILQRKIRNGTDSFLRGPAMKLQEAIAAVKVGIDAVETLYQRGYTLLGTGEMGIGNTSTATAVICALTGNDPGEITGRGAGLTDEGYRNKVQVIREGLRINGLLKDDRPSMDDRMLKDDQSFLNRKTEASISAVMELLSKVGGLDICGMVGCYIAAGYYRMPIVVDGVISIAAALAAYRMNPVLKDYMIASHVSMEPAYEAAATEIGLHPSLNLNMRLGEGSGCPLMFGIIQGACACMNDIASFDEMKVNGDFLVDNRSVNEEGDVIMT